MSTIPTSRVALVTCEALPELDEDSRHLLALLPTRGVAATAAIWSDPAVDWTAFDLVIIRSCWDYVHRRDEFLAWCARNPNLANPAGVVAWNTHKQYLRELEAAGVPTVPTLWLEPGETWQVPATGEWVIKPAVSIAALDTGRYRLDDPDQRCLAQAHVARLQSAGRLVMVQPYMSVIDSQGETSLVFFNGMFSHSMRKPAVLSGPDEGVDRRFLPAGTHRLQRHEPTAAELTVAMQALAVSKARELDLLYARVDLVPGPGGQPLVIEVELTEPQLYLSHGCAASRFAAVIAATAARRRQVRGTPSHDAIAAVSPCDTTFRTQPARRCGR